MAITEFYCTFAFDSRSFCIERVVFILCDSSGFLSAYESSAFYEGVLRTLKTTFEMSEMKLHVYFWARRTYVCCVYM